MAHKDDVYANSSRNMSETDADDFVKVRHALGSFEAAEGLFKHGAFGIERQPPTPLPGDKKRKSFPTVPPPSSKPREGGGSSLQKSDTRKQSDSTVRSGSDTRVKPEVKPDPGKRLSNETSSVHKHDQKPAQQSVNSNQKTSSSSSQKVPKPDSVKQTPVLHSSNKNPVVIKREPVLETFNQKYVVQSKGESSKTATKSAPSLTSKAPETSTESRPVLKEKEGYKNVNGRIKPRPQLHIPENVEEMLMEFDVPQPLTAIQTPFKEKEPKFPFQVTVTAFSSSSCSVVVFYMCLVFQSNGVLGILHFLCPWFLLRYSDIPYVPSYYTKFYSVLDSPCSILVINMCLVFYTKSCSVRDSPCGILVFHMCLVFYTKSCSVRDSPCSILVINMCLVFYTKSCSVRDSPCGILVFHMCLVLYTKSCSVRDSPCSILVFHMCLVLYTKPYSESNKADQAKTDLFLGAGAGSNVRGEDLGGKGPRGAPVMLSPVQSRVVEEIQEKDTSSSDDDSASESGTDDSNDDDEQAHDSVEPARTHQEPSGKKITGPDPPRVGPGSRGPMAPDKTQQGFVKSLFGATKIEIFKRCGENNEMRIGGNNKTVEAVGKDKFIKKSLNLLAFPYLVKVYIWISGRKVDRMWGQFCELMAAQTRTHQGQRQMPVLERMDTYSGRSSSDSSSSDSGDSSDGESDRDSDNEGPVGHVQVTTPAQKSASPEYGTETTPSPQSGKWKLDNFLQKGPQSLLNGKPPSVEAPPSDKSEDHFDGDRHFDALPVREPTKHSESEESSDSESASSSSGSSSSTSSDSDNDSEVENESSKPLSPIHDYNTASNHSLHQSPPDVKKRKLDSSRNDDSKRRRTLPSSPFKQSTPVQNSEPVAISPVEERGGSRLPGSVKRERHNSGSSQHSTRSHASTHSLASTHSRASSRGNKRPKVAANPGTATVVAPSPATIKDLKPTLPSIDRSDRALNSQSVPVDTSQHNGVLRGPPVVRGGFSLLEHHKDDERLLSADEYHNRGRKFKYQAEDMDAGLVKNLIYLESVLCFIQSGCAMERNNIPADATKMYKDTQAFVAHQYHQFELAQRSPQNPDKPEHKLARIQSLLFMRLYSLKKKETLKLKQILEEHHKKGSDQTPSKLCNGTSGGVPPGSIVVSQRIHSITQKYFSNANYLIQAHNYWEMADDKVTDDIREFFIELDHECGPLTLHSSIQHLVRYVRLAISHIHV
ncbi:AFF2-like protein [Mya arenaria]|uniref:AF4/FMR2 family member lilli n=1 Tax=Mya arenaria TaxID=6604 RepID=A0ABY7DSM8_MYAAR|nr:AFF2-like protein [Mya arenaria]